MAVPTSANERLADAEILNIEDAQRSKKLFKKEQPVKSIKLFIMTIMFFLTFAFDAMAGGTYYARCNLKVVKNQISWVNWQAAPNHIPVGTALKVAYEGGDTAEVEDKETGKKLTIDIGDSGEKFLEKFVSKSPVSIKGMSPDTQTNIRKNLIKIGMSKKEAYIAMGPPANADYVNTNSMTYEDILKTDLWVYKRKRFAKNIGVHFNRAGKVDKTEGIWRD